MKTMLSPEGWPRPKGYANALMAGRSLDALARENVIDVSVVKTALSELGIDPDKSNPVST